MNRQIAILWKSAAPHVRVEVANGTLKSVRVASPARLEATVAGARCRPGADATLISVVTSENPCPPDGRRAFSFFLRDVSKANPILIPAFGVAVTEASDRRSYREIERAVRKRKGKTVLQDIETQPEESWEAASAATRNMVCPTWLGLSRDIRIFELALRREPEAWHSVKPRFHGHSVFLRETEKAPLRYNFLFGRGIGCVEHITRRLEDGVLPILHATQVDGDIQYRITAFVAYEKKPLSAASLRGTHFRVADNYSLGIMLSDEDRRRIAKLEPRELSRDEETVFYLRAEAVNTAPVPRYAWFRAPFPGTAGSLANPVCPIRFDGTRGFACYAKTGAVFCVARLGGKPMPEEEMAVLVAPGQKITCDFVIPHRPIPKARAVRLAKQGFDRRHAECRRFWMSKLARAAKVILPEKRIDEMVRAGLLHLDLITYGREPEGPLAATVGIYSPIGSESSPIIQFLDSMGRHDLAGRALDYFLEKQHPDGLIMTFGGYRLETGAALWSIGEHYRYTRDDAWAKRIQSKLLRACDYIIAWRRRNLREDLRGRGYGMMEGKVADPEDPFHSFMLNGYMYLGMTRVAEMLANINPGHSKRLAREAAALKSDIRAGFAEAMAKSPVVPLGDGTWCPTAPPWCEARGPLCIFTRKGNCFTHGAFPARDSLLGPLYLVLQEVLDPREQAVDFLVNYHAELMHVRNVALSQPYYSPHPFAHLRRGETRAFLKAYYNGLAGLADRETYTFWEHYFHASPHKTHEEGWFLMQTRWMLYIEEGRTLRLLAGIPRAWLSDGQSITLDGVATYFGPLTLHVQSDLKKRRIDAEIEVASKAPPDAVEIRLPHPRHRKAVKVAGGTYFARSETVRVEPFSNRARVTLRF